MSNVQNQSAARDVLNKRLEELLQMKGNVLHRIEPLQKQLDQINEQLQALNDLAPLFYTVEIEAVKRENAAALQNKLAEQIKDIKLEQEKNKQENQ